MSWKQVDVTVGTSEYGVCGSDGVLWCACTRYGDHDMREQEDTEMEGEVRVLRDDVRVLQDRHFVAFDRREVQ